MTRQTFFYLLVLLVFSSCSIDSEISSLKISPVLIDSNINIRAIEIKNNKVYSATSNGSILYFEIDKSDVISEINYEIENDSIVPNFRSLALTENDVFAMFQHPHVSYASVIIKRVEEHPFLRADGIGNGQQIWFDLWTPYHDSLNEAERFFSAYSLLNNRQHLRKALDFVDQNLAAYYPTLFEQK